MSNYEIKKICVVSIIKKDNKFLFLKRARTGAGDGFYMFPGGHVDKDETVLQAAVRELKEELNITIQENDLLFRLVTTSKSHVNFFFEVLSYQGTIQNNEPEKHDDCAFLTPDHADIHPLCLMEIDAMKSGISFLSED